MLLTCYLASAALFYVIVARRAPIAEEPVLAHAVQPAPCEVIELFATPADQAASRAA
jgi:hypothetical protein